MGAASATNMQQMQMNLQMQQGQQMPYGTGNGGFQGGQMGYGAANAGAQAVRLTADCKSAVDLSCLPCGKHRKILQRVWKTKAFRRVDLSKLRYC